MLIFAIIMTCFIAYFLIKHIYSLAIGIDDFNNFQRRMILLKKGKKNRLSSSDKDVQFFNQITKPIVDKVVRKLTLKDTEILERKLKSLNWDKYFNPEQWIALGILSKSIGVLLCLLLFPFSELGSVIVLGFLWFSNNVLMELSIRDRKTKLLYTFPLFVNLLKSFLGAGYNLSDSITLIIPYMNSEWQKVLTKFGSNLKYGVSKDDDEEIQKNTKLALNELAKDIDIIDVDGVLLLLKSNLDNSLSIRESLEQQADRIAQIQQTKIEKIIVQRQSYVLILCFPMLLMVILMMTAPILLDFLNLGSL